MSKPLLSIGIIFKNEIRCLERCLKSFQPLREVIHCELVMADTGSDDGSREVAEQYADILFDFPWINDFAAARNAVMDRCTGKWYMTVDADEWLDGDISQMIEFLGDFSRKENFCTLVVRNYSFYTSKDNYSDFFAVRIVRLSTGVRYEGAIHETWNKTAKSIFVLNRTILHHDGYVGLGAEEGKEKRARNMALLREELKKFPDDMRRRLQCAESSDGDPDHEDYVRLAVEGVRKKLPGWDKYGPAIFRSAIIWAARQATDELDTFAEDARALFPDSMFTRLDIEYISCCAFFKEKNYEKAIPAGEAYLRAMADYRANRLNLADMLHSTVGSITPLNENHIRLLLAESCFQVKDFQRSLEHLTALEFDKLKFSDFKNSIGIMLNLQAQSGLDSSGHMLRLWDYLEALKENDPETVQRKGALISTAAAVFPQSYRDTEVEKGYGHAYTVFLPLAGTFEMGTAARILETTDTSELEVFLGDVKDWNLFPIHALAHALKCGVRFPLPDKPLNIEEMDAYSSRLAQDKYGLRLLVERATEREIPDNIREFVWTRGMVFAAMRKFGWSGEDVDVEQGMGLIRAFAKIEEKYLPLCYAPEALQEENLFILPALHRFGFYCVRAFDALDRGDAAEYVRLLRAGLAACESVKAMVEFLVEHTPELQMQPEPSAELLTLAEQIRTILAGFAPDDPTVAVLKQSEAYQKVAYLIEGIEVPVMGGLLQ